MIRNEERNWNNNYRIRADPENGDYRGLRRAGHRQELRGEKGTIETVGGRKETHNTS